MHWLKYLDNYEVGNITAMELRFHLLQKLTEENVPQVWKRIPEETKHLFLEVVEPEYYENRHKLRHFAMVSHIIRTEEVRQAFEKRKEEEHQHYCRGVEILRRHIDKV